MLTEDLFETILSKDYPEKSDSLNHASIIDGVRLCKAARYRYANNNMEDLEAQLIAANKENPRFKIIVTWMATWHPSNKY